MESQYSRFQRKKAAILAQLSLPDAEYDDLSPKGSVDVGIRKLIDEINAREELVTTSSCAGRVSVFLEGFKKGVNTSGLQTDDDSSTLHTNEDGTVTNTTKLAAAGGKGGGGRWLYVSHDPIDLSGIEDVNTFLGLDSSTPVSLTADSATQERLIHFKFEPMILHILTASTEHAQLVLSAALQAGFRESGALNLVSNTSEASTPMVGIRTNGIALESIIGITCDDQVKPIVSSDHLKALLSIGNDRFRENSKRIERFRILLKNVYEQSTKPKGKAKKTKDNGEEWEDPEARRIRKREEGLKRSRGEI